MLIPLLRGPRRASNAAELMRAADVAVSQVKTEGKNRWVIFDPHRNT